MEELWAYSTPFNQITTMKMMTTFLIYCAFEILVTWKGSCLLFNLEWWIELVIIMHITWRSLLIIVRLETQWQFLEKRFGGWEGVLFILVALCHLSWKVKFLESYLTHRAVNNALVLISQLQFTGLPTEEIQYCFWRGTSIMHVFSFVFKRVILVYNFYDIFNSYVTYI